MSNILIIEDEPSIADNILIALEREGFEAQHASTLAQANEFLLDPRHTFSLIILDIGLPDGNGFDFCRDLRQQGNQLPVIMLTARADEVDRIVGLEIGADDYVTKPFSSRELIARLRAILRRCQPSTATDLSATKPTEASLAINEDTFRAHWGKELLPLSAHEFRLIAVLAASPGRIFSRSQLLQMAWQDANSAMERTIDAHIKSLRAKLRRHTATEVIVTHRGFGYSLNMEN